MAPEGFSPPAPAGEAAALPLNAGELAQDSGSGEVDPALRLAGGVLLLNAVLVLAERVLLSGPVGNGPGGAGAGLVSAVIDAGLGISLLTGNDRYRSLASLRAALGLLVFTGLHAFRGDMVSAAVQLFFSGSLLMLLVGTPSGLRRTLALLGVSLCLLLEGAGLYSLRTGRDLFGGVFSGAQEVKGGVITGRKFPFRMNVPGASWRMRSEESAAKDNPLVDRWLIHPKTGANLLLIGEEIPAGSQVNLDAFGKAVVNNLRKGMSVYETQPPVCDNFGGIPTCLIRGSGNANMVAVEYEIRVFSTPGAAYQFIAFGPTESFLPLQDELRQAAQSFAIE
ncbi:hypothetical protein [Archangium lansingense]|uniref:Uncharacterized protein n=1 Tax=Archangium lansingense TaxID=2995310 RepID=A0ABT4AK34_9BACT|nr:hypothetical protein [Archangium lansinium]MCY1081217.1 hypothetical protein [Archangium lansinium]